MANMDSKTSRDTPVNSRITASDMPCACTIAGSDSGGGAGIQADLKTFAALGVWGCSVITSLTAQNPCSVIGIENASPNIVKLQMQAVSDDFNIKAYKTGMLPTEEIIRTVAANLPTNIPAVIDPVMISTSGKKLIDDNAKEALKSELLPLAKIITPNIPETCELSGIYLCKNSSESEIAKAAMEILKSGTEYVLIKGGHLSGGFSSDYLISESHDGKDTPYETDELLNTLTGSSLIDNSLTGTSLNDCRCRVDKVKEINGLNIVKYTGLRFCGDIHGSGCCLSSAIAAGLAKGYTAEKACACAKVFIAGAIQSAYISESKKYSINPGYQQ